MGRATQGVRVMNLREGDRLSSIARVTEPQIVVDAGEEGDRPVELEPAEPDAVDAVAETKPRRRRRTRNRRATPRK